MFYFPSKTFLSQMSRVEPVVATRTSRIRPVELFWAARNEHDPPQLDHRAVGDLIRRAPPGEPTNLNYFVGEPPADSVVYDLSLREPFEWQGPWDAADGEPARLVTYRHLPNAGRAPAPAVSGGRFVEDPQLGPVLELGGPQDAIWLARNRDTVMDPEGHPGTGSGERVPRGSGGFRDGVPGTPYVTLRHLGAFCYDQAMVRLTRVVIPGVPRSEDGLRRAIGEAHRRYTRGVNFREGWRGHLWQGRFASFVMDEPYLLAAARYIELNPVRAGLVTSPSDYRWSSARAHLKGNDDLLVKVAPMLALARDWRRRAYHPFCRCGNRA